MKHKVFILLTLFVLSSFYPLIHADINLDQSETIKIGGIFALNEDTNRGNVERVSVLKAAIQEINNNPELLPDHQIELIIRDSQSSPQTGLQAAEELIDEGVVAIIGPSLSSVAEVVASGPANDHKIPLVSPSATAAILGDKSQFPFFTRVAPSDIYQGRALVDLVRYFGWQEISLISTSDIYGENITPLTNGTGGNAISVGIESYESIAAKFDIDIINNLRINPANPDYSATLEDIKSSDSNIILVNLVFNQAKELFREAYELEMNAENGFVWIGTDGITQNELIESSANIRDVLLGLVGISPVLGEDLLDQFLDKWENCFAGDLGFYPGCGDRSPNTYVTYTYDALYLLVEAIQDLMDEELDFTDGENLRDQLYETTLAGITGLVDLNEFGERDGKYRIVNLQLDGFVQVGKWSEDTDIEVTGTIYWNGDNFGTATDIPMARNQIFPFPGNLFLIVIVLIGLGKYRFGKRSCK